MCCVKKNLYGTNISWTLFLNRYPLVNVNDSLFFGLNYLTNQNVCGTGKLSKILKEDTRFNNYTKGL